MGARPDIHIHNLLSLNKRYITFYIVPQMFEEELFEDFIKVFR